MPKSNISLRSAAPLQQFDAKATVHSASRAKSPCYHRRRFSTAVPAFANSLMADANDPTAPPLASRILAAVRARVEAHQKIFLAVVVAIAVATLPAARAQESDTVTLNFVNADIDAVVKAVAEITGRNFVLDPRVKGTINIVSARPVAKALVYPTLLSALRMQFGGHHEKK